MIFERRGRKMSKNEVRNAKHYLERSLASQRRLGYSSRVEPAVFDAALIETSRAVERLRKAQRPTTSA
jgi:hypothetical protein